MHRLRFHCAWLVPLVLAARAGAEDVAAADDPENAAIVYREAYERYADIEYHFERWHHIWAFHSLPDRGPSTVARQLLARHRPIVELVARGARRERCDFQPPADPHDPMANMHFTRMRTLSWLVRDDFLLRMHDGEIGTAMRRIAVILRMAEHLAQERRLMAALVASAIVTLADGQIEHGIDRALIGPQEASFLLRELARFEGDDPLRYREASHNERASVAAHNARYRGEGGLERLREDYGAYFDQSAPHAAEALRHATQDELDRAIDDAAAAYDRFLAAMNEADPNIATAAIGSLDAEAGQDAGQPFAGVLGGGWTHSFRAMRRTRKQLDDRAAMLRDIAEGRVDPMSLANRATWLIRASAEIERVDPDALAAIDRAYAAAPKQPDEALDRVFARDDLRRTLDLLSTGAQGDRCDFTFYHPGLEVSFRPYHAGLLACGRMLAVDAQHLLARGEAAAAAARLALGYRLAARLGADGALAGSLAAHRIFDDVDDVAAPAIERGDFDDASLALLADAVNAFARDDPFDYQSGISRHREQARRWLAHLVQGAPERPRGDQKFVDEADAILRELNDDAVLAFVAIGDELALRREPAARSSALRPAGLEPIFDLAALQAARDLAPAFNDWAKRGIIGEIRSMRWPIIAPVEQRARESTDACRACAARLDRAAAGSRAHR